MPLKSVAPMLNYHLPHTAFLCAAFNLGENSGTTITNLARTEFSLGDGTASAASWTTTTDGVAFDGTAGATISFGTATGDRRMDTGHMLVKWTGTGTNAAVRNIVCSDTTVGTSHGKFSAFWASGANTFTVQIRDSIAAVTRVLSWTNRDRSLTHTLQVSWGNGYTATLDGQPPDVDATGMTTATMYVRTPNTKTWVLNTDAGGNSGLCKLECFYLWNRQLTARDMAQLDDDPHLPAREPPGYTAELAGASAWAATTDYSLGDIRKRLTGSGSQYFEVTIDNGSSAGSEPTWPTVSTTTVVDDGIQWTARTPSGFVFTNNCPAGRLTTTGVTFRATISKWKKSAGTHYVRVKVATTAAGLDSATPVTGSSNTAETVIDMAQTGLSADTSYYRRCEWSTDNSTWYPFPGGMGQFKTLGGAGVTQVPMILPDSHINVGTGGIFPDSIGPGYPIAIDSSGAVNSTYGYRNRWCVSETVHDAWQQTTLPSFIILGGDHVMPDTESGSGTSDTTSYKYQQWRSWGVVFNEIFNLGAMFYLLGNHEGENGYQQKDGTDAIQKQCTVVRKKCFPNPTNSTYTQGGETGSTWIDPALAGGAYVVDSPGLNVSPLENYWAFEAGDCLFVFLDTNRYSDIGTYGGTYRSTPNRFTLGSTQIAWLQSKLATSTKKWKIVVAHDTCGGIGAGQTSGTQFYSRASGGSIGSSDPYSSLGVSEGANELQEHRLFRGYGVTSVWKFHDHKFERVTKNGVEYVTWGTMGAPSHAQVSPMGWHQAELRNEYGTAESLGALDDNGNSTSTKGIVKHINVMGFGTASISTSTFTINWRQSVIGCVGASESDEAKFYTPANGERYYNENTATPTATKKVTLVDSLNSSPVPRHIAGVFADGTFDTSGTYSGGSTNYHGAPGASAFVGSTNYSTLYQLVKPTSANGFIYQVTTTGIASATEPTHTGTAATDWPVTIGGTVTNGATVFTCVGKLDPRRYIMGGQDATAIPCISTVPATVRIEWAPRWVYTADLTLKAAEPSVLSVKPSSVAKKLSFLL